MNERRKNDRIPIQHPIIYGVANSKGQVDVQGIGMALDVNSDGMMFASDDPVDASTVAIHASDQNGKKMKIDGFLVYSMPHADGKYRSGVRFDENAANVSQFVAALRQSAVPPENARD